MGTEGMIGDDLIAAAPIDDPNFMKEAEAEFLDMQREADRSPPVEGGGRRGFFVSSIGLLAVVFAMSFA